MPHESCLWPMPHYRLAKTLAHLLVHSPVRAVLGKHSFAVPVKLLHMRIAAGEFEVLHLEFDNLTQQQYDRAYMDQLEIGMRPHIFRHLRMFGPFRLSRNQIVNHTPQQVSLLRRFFLAILRKLGAMFRSAIWRPGRRKPPIFWLPESGLTGFAS